MARTRLLLAYGGRSAEHEISLRSSRELAAAVDRERFELHLLAIARDGSMREGPGDQDLAEVMEDGAPVTALNALGADVVFPLLHGPYGEDGCIQGLLEHYGLPYVGSGVLASALCMDKIAFKQHVAHPPYSLPVVAEVAARFGWGESADAEERGRVCDEVEARLGYPCFVKPANLGSSVGVSRCPDRDALDTALREAASFDPRVVVEQGVDAREIELAVLGDGGPSTRVSPAGEIILPPGRWYDYETKYEKDDAGLQIPAEIDASLQARLQELALRAFRATGAHGLARVDFFVERGADEPRVWLNELNTLPGFTSISMYPKLMEAAGVPYRELITRLAELALARHTARTSLRSARR